MSSFPELDKYIAEARQADMSDEQIQDELLKAGWNLPDVIVGLESVKKPLAVAASPDSLRGNGSLRDSLPSSVVPSQALSKTSPQISAISLKPEFKSQPQVEMAPTQNIANVIVRTEKVNLAASDTSQKTASFGLPPVQASPHRSKFLVILIVLILFAVSGGVGFAYFFKMGPFWKIPYTESDFVSGLLSKFSAINTASYVFSLDSNVGPRDPGASAFNIQVLSEGQLREQYQNDSIRSRNVYSLIGGLNDEIYDKKVYPAKLGPELDNDSNYRSDFSINDPVSKKPYLYSRTSGGKDFALTVSFETDNAISTISNSYDFSSTTTLINGKEVTFTKASPRYLYLPEEPPQPFLSMLSESVRMMPPDVSAKIALSATTDWTESDQSDWRFNLEGVGDLGDMTYSVNVDALRKGDSYYFRVNKIPSLFLTSLAFIKGQWIKIDPATLSSSSSSSSGAYEQFFYNITAFPEVEESYKESRVAMIAFIKKAATFADEENLFVFKNLPEKESLDGRSLYRFDLKIRKEAIVSFYKKLIAEAAKSKTGELSSFVAEQGTLDYLQSPEFDEVFDYLDQNTSVAVWVDRNGFPAAVQYTLRVVPPDTALQLKDKQVNFIFKLAFSGINEPVIIETPSDSKPVQQVISEYKKNQTDYSVSSSVDKVKADLGNVRVSAEMVYDKEGGYGKKAFPLGECGPTLGTLFEDEAVFQAIKSAGGGDASKARCVGTTIGGKVAGYAVSVPVPGLTGYSWCVDSTGVSKQIAGQLDGDSCEK